MVQDLAIFSAIIAVGFLAAVAFYESLSTRDVLVARSSTLVRRATQSRLALSLAYGLTVFGFVPVLVALWALVLEAALGIVVSPDRPDVAESAVAIVTAARVLAYVREKTSHELAKAIPIALAFSVLIGGLSQLEENVRVIAEEPPSSELTIEIVGFLVALEIGLRLTNDATRAAIGALASRRRRESRPANGDELHESE